MVVAIGIDVVEVDRIARACARFPFAERILTPRELKFCRTPAQIAGRWAAKEAAMKCLGFRTTFREIEVGRSDSGAPTLELPTHPSLEGLRCLVSISHERTIAMAVVVLDRP